MTIIHHDTRLSSMRSGQCRSPTTDSLPHPPGPPILAKRTLDLASVTAEDVSFCCFLFAPREHTVTVAAPEHMNGKFGLHILARIRQCVKTHRYAHSRNAVIFIVVVAVFIAS